MPAPTITGTVSSQATTSETPIDPFSGVTIGDANAGATDTLSIALSGPGSLSGTGLSVSSGIYTLTGTAAAITSELRALSFTSVDGVPNTSVTTTFTLSDTSSAYGVASQLSTLATFTGANGTIPWSDLVTDAAGDLFGVTFGGGADNDGTVFEIAKSTGALTTVATFTGANGTEPWGVASDAAGDLIGTTAYGGADGDGTVFEIAKSTGQLTTLATFTGANGEYPFGTVISDAAGDLFGTTAHGGADGFGTVFEIAKSTGQLTTLATFTGANGATPAGSLTIDAEGDLFGTTANGGAGGADGDGTVFEIAESTGELTTLATFTGSNGESPERGLTIDAAGDLFGTTFQGGADNDGTVFEIVKSTGALITLATFTGANGASPLSQLVSDAAGDLFGTTEIGGADNDGTAFEIVKSTGALITLATFTGANGGELDGGLTINSAGDLFGTTFYGGANDDGTVFELPATFVATPVVDATTTVTEAATVGPVLVTAGASVSYVAGAAPVALDAGLTVADAAAVSLSAATVSISAGFAQGDTLSVGSLQTGIVGQYNAATGVLTLSGSASLAAYKTELDSITFASATATASSRTIAWSVNDGVNASAPVTSHVSVSRLPPVVTAGASVSYVAGAAPVALDAGLTVADAAAVSLSAATVSISAGFAQGDTLSVGSPQTGIVGQYNAATGVLTLSGSASLAAYKTELDSITFASATATASSRTIAWSVNDGVNASAPVTSHVSVGPAPPDLSAPAPDLNILWQNANGQAAIWEMDGTNVIASAKVGANPGPSWKVVGAGDFNGDRNSDLLWQNTDGQAAIWEMDGTNVIASAKVGANPGPSWKLVGTGDFNGDGNSDLLWQNTSGQVAIWEMDGTNVIDSAKVGPNPGSSWKLVGTGDFNGDGKSDLLWQNTDGQAAIWEMDGTNVIDSAKVGPNPGPSWKVVGTGDFNGDGKSDLLWQNTSGQVAIWDMDGTNVLASAKVDTNPGSTWQAIGAGAGGSDILLQNTSGQASIWEMNGNAIAGGGPISVNPGSSWQAVGLT